MSDFPISAAPAWRAPSRAARPLAAPHQRRSLLSGLASLPKRLHHSARLVGAGQTLQESTALARYASHRLDSEVLGLTLGQDAPEVTLRGDITVAASVAFTHLDTYRRVFREHRWGRVPGFRAKPGQTVVDAGAGAGFYALWQARAVGPLGRVVALESDADAFAVLADNVARNEMTWVHASAGMRGPATRTLDQIVACDALKRIDVLRLTADSALEVLNGGLRLALPITDRIVIEAADDATHELLLGHGFKLRRNPESAGIDYFARI